MAGDRLRSVISSIIRRRGGLTADVALAMGWSAVYRLVSAAKPSHEEVIPANSDARPASAGSFNPLTIQPEGIALQPVELGSPASHSGWS